ncbi:GAF domain-containing sensor histidine kinase [Auraticoccus monumenti]|nr:GAF domain-containing protein [Auraticoccus monumenti]
MASAAGPSTAPTAAPVDGIAPDRLAQLLEAQRALVEDLSLTDVLVRVVRVARQVSGARYAALGVIDEHGRLEQFVHDGMDEATVAAIGPLPRGRGLLGALVDHPQVIRLGRLSEDHRSAGFPPGHPPMSTFLGVPVRHHDEVLGNLYLTERRGGGPFTLADEQVVEALAITAGSAVANARVYQQAVQRQSWMRASAEISREIVAMGDEGEVLQQVADVVRHLAEADVVSVVRPSPPDHLCVQVASGLRQDELLGHRYPRAGSLAQQAMDTGQGLVVHRIGPEASDQEPWVHLTAVLPVVTAMVFPLRSEHQAQGAIVVGRLEGRPAFSRDSLQMAETFANQAALALEVAAARQSRERLHVLDERDRIARDLHDHVIQRVFAAGLTLQSLAAQETDPVLRPRLGELVEQMDDIIGQIRDTIFDLHEPEDRTSIRERLTAAAAEASQGAALRLSTGFKGPLAAADEHLGDLTAVVREGISNTVKHASASRVALEVSADERSLQVKIVDDGVGWEQAGPHSGLENLRWRAERLGGQLVLRDNPDGGATLVWRIPLQEAS